uniref:F-box domain-containing protein n=1 Tax=Strongyloides venezuelensis TaxID=75913 RepID=A0A0K0F5D2_STRVS
MVKTKGQIRKSIKKYFRVPKVEEFKKHRNVKKKKSGRFQIKKSSIIFFCISRSMKSHEIDGSNRNQTLSNAEIDGRSDGICISASMKHYQNVCNNENQTSASPEIVGRSNYLMSLVIRILPNHTDRYNLETTCKYFYNLCSERRNFIPFLKLRDRQIQTLPVENIEELFRSFKI